ncbi:MAG TPA: tetratricopeptide repeat protein [Bryobacteraceae bacterium]|nr:tetratricopeptide repeat protein [Bryobacteraceae bacterium]
MPDSHSLKRRIAFVVFCLLLVNTAYIAAFADPTVFYMTNVLLHLALGAAALAVCLWAFGFRPQRAGWVLLLIASGLGGYLVFAGNTFPNRWVLWAHMAAGAIAVVAVGLFLWRQFPGLPFRRALAGSALLLIALPAGAVAYRKVFPNPKDRIRNPDTVPVAMHEEGGGPKSPFWPSSAKTNVGGTIPSNFFMDSELCGKCHKDIYEQWKSSVHHFASFNNQFYRKSIEYMQSISGTQGSKWCAGCHDHAVFFNGRFDQPIKDQIDTPEAQNGLGCVSCHSITHVDSSMGNGGFEIEYPPLHELASSRNKYIRALDDFLTYLDPEPHRKTFMKPFMRLDSSEYCSTCHKVHLDVPVNNYRWIRGFNDYDNWQASGVSGQGARSFYYPPKSSSCSDCHMPRVKSKDPGNRDGWIHSHRFATANTAVAYVNKDQTQLSETEKFLKSGFITVDIFAASPVEEMPGQPEMLRRRTEGPQLASTFAVGEESDQGGAVFLREVGKVAAPINKAGTQFQPGSTLRVDVVVRTRKVGHFFPGGTVDSFDIWLELMGKDAAGKRIYWSGRVEDDGKGPVEPGAHFYRSFQLDADGNPINKRNAFQTRSVLYVRLIPPGAADVAHYRVKLPPDVKGPVTLEAKLNYRKFSHFYNQFSYAGEPEPGQNPSLVGLGHNNLKYSFAVKNIPKNVAGEIKDRIPDLPIITLAQATAKLNVADTRVGIGSTTTAWKPVVSKEDRERWNDWGIGLLLQGDLKAAEYAFTRVTEAEPGYADGWLNIARALIQEGETDRAKPFIEKALALDRSLARTHFFKAMIQKADGDYDAALASLAFVRAKYPRDRVNLNQIGRILFLKKEYAKAVEALRAVLQVDPEDVQAHYTLMLAYRGLGQTENAAREEKLFRRFKADESSQAITARQRMISPEDNNERQMIHDHESVRLP